MKRFYNTAEYSVSPDGACVLELDGKSVKTPERNIVMTFHKDLAETICAEWQAQKEDIDPKTMPMTRLLNTRIDLVESEESRHRLMEEVLNFIESDLICYYADTPEDLVARQRAAWQPIQDWFEKRSGLTLKTSTGIQFVEQDEGLKEWSFNALKAMDPYRFTAFQSAIGPLGSFVITLALIEGQCDANTAFEAAQIDELYQAEQWGSDEADDKKRAKMLEDLLEIKNFMDLTGKKQLAPFAV
jgi:chaperone required for assembly of F1-ATPase